MAKQKRERPPPLERLLQRWMEMDRDLCCGWLRIPEFAESWEVDPKTIRRDLDLFERMGYPSELRIIKPGVSYCRRYASGQAPMFAASEQARREHERHKRDRGNRDLFE